MADAPSFPPSRALVLHTMLSLLVSAAVFVVVSQLVIVPQMARQEAEIRSLRAELSELRGALEEESATAESAVKAAIATPPPAAPAAQPAK